MRSQCVDFDIVEALCDKFPVDVSLRLDRGCKSQIIAMFGDPWIDLAERIVTVARPSISGWVVDDPRSDRIQFDVAIAGEWKRWKRGQIHFDVIAN